MSDPFDDLDEYDDRDGDPFEDLDTDVDEGDSNGAAAGSSTSDPESDTGTDDAGKDTADGTDPSVADPFEYLDSAAPGVPDAAADADVEDRPAVEAPTGEQVDVAGDPFGDVDVSRGDPFESSESPFRHVDVDGVDPDEVWQRFTDGVSADATAEPATEDVVVVSKHEFCEGCPHFTPPPETECTHGGTEIVEFVGPDDVRVSNCPIVRERRELGEVHE